MEVRIQSVVVEFILNHVDVLFSTKLSTLIREGAGTHRRLLDKTVIPPPTAASTRALKHLCSLLCASPGHNSLSRPKSLLVSSPSTKLLTLEEAQARTQAQINSPVTEDSKYIEVGEGPAALQGKFHTVIEFPTERFVNSSSLLVMMTIINVNLDTETDRCLSYSAHLLVTKNIFKVVGLEEQCWNVSPSAGCSSHCRQSHIPPVTVCRYIKNKDFTHV